MSWRNPSGRAGRGEERKLQRECEGWLRQLIAWGAVRAYYHRPDQKPRRSEERGLPDLVIALPARVVGVELKAEGGKVSEEQAIWLESLGASGAICTSLSEFQSKLKAWGAG